MDAQAYLLRHGWAGPGNPLNPSRRLGPHAGLGLSKPILVARRSGNEGVGKKTTKDPTNQWWLRGFEDALKGVGQEDGVGDGGRKPNALTSELYRFFVRGEGMAGTIGGSKEEVNGKGEKKEKRKRGDDDDNEKKASRTEEKSKKRKTDESSERKESKEERRRRKEEKKLKKEAKENKKAEKAAAKEEKKAKKAKKSKQESNPEDDYPTPTSTEDSSGQDESVELEEPSKKEKSDKKDKKEKKDKS
ncbi:uncharacterized protein EURHEDRAFT_408269, partial [Aspergillus ruber CBS 135680]